MPPEDPTVTRNSIKDARSVLGCRSYTLNEARRLSLTGVALKAEAQRLESGSWH